MIETEHAQWIRQFWKDKLDEIKGADRMTEFDEWEKRESEKERNKECRKTKHECSKCEYLENCQYEEMLNSIEEW